MFRGTEADNRTQENHTYPEGKYIYRGICAVVLTSVSTILFFFMWFRFVLENNQTGHLLGIGNIGMVVGIYSVLFLFIGHFIGTFRIGVDRKASVMASSVLTAITVDFIEVFLSMAITGQFRFILAFFVRYVILFFLQCFILCVLLIPMINIYRKVFPPLQILEVYGDREHGIQNKLDKIKYKYHVTDMVHYKKGISEIRKRMKNVDAVLVSDIPSHEKNEILKACVDLNKRAYFVPKISDVIVRYSEGLNVIDTPLFLRRKIGISWWESIIKRLFDIVLSLLAIVLLSPVLFVTALAVKIEDGGPVFYRQERVTIGGKRFMIVKFRSMIVDAEKDGRARPAGEKDDRITRVGRVIRSCRVDELPQLLNILKGDMSIVGPRPERWEHVEMYTKQIPEFAFREKVKGGLTGYAQVYGKYNTTALDKLKMDLVYIMNYSIIMDLQIIFETVKILLKKESTEGFSVEMVEEIHGR